jgi:leader peptidase (prepilin peptidase)/N-methyltransferase
MVDEVTTLVAVVICVWAGLLVGSFLTVVVDRVPRGASVVRPHSACGACGHRLTALDLVPIASWLALRGKCRHCGAKIGVAPLVIEAATVTVFVLFALRFGAEPELVAFCILGASLVALTWIDLHEKRLPREISYTALVLGAIALTIAALIAGEAERIVLMALGAAIALALMGAIYLASKGGLGDGDVRLSPLLGSYLGWLNPGLVPVGLFFGFLFGAVVGVTMMARGKAGRRTALPFGPFLALGTVVAVFVGQGFIDVVLQR